MNTLILISNDELIQTIIMEQLENSDLELHISNVSNLLANIYKYNPKGVILYYDTLGYDALESISATLSISYIPTIAVVKNPDLLKLPSPITNLTTILTTNLHILLPTLVKQLLNFSSNYEALSKGYDTFTLMDDEYKRVMNYFLSAKETYENRIIEEYFKIIYSDNPFLTNKPSVIWLLENMNSHILATEITSTPNSNQFKELTILQSTTISYFEHSKETGFYVNINSDEFSDIENLVQILPSELLKIIQPKKNIAVVSTDDLLILCYDYNEKIMVNDIAILKAMAVKIDMMKTVKHKVNDIHQAFVYTMDALARAAESKDDVTGQHIKRVNYFSRGLAIELNLDTTFIEEIEIAAQMHDVGKITISENILNKPGRLTEEEFKIIQNHTISGEEIIGKSKYLEMAKRIARSHHEKYDGTGYPDGLKGNNIPLEARIVSLADIYDALRSPRSYKPPFTHERAYDIIVNGDGRVEPSHFDPQVLQAFINIHNNFSIIYDNNKDI